MTYPIVEKNISFQINSLLKKHGIEAKLAEIEKLSKTVKNTIEFNQKLYTVGTLNDVSLATSVEDLIDIYMLRDEVYREIDYRSEFPEIIKGLHFDEYDEHSAMVCSKRDGVITGTCRLVFDSTDRKLPTDEKFSLDYLRNQNRNLGEASRVIIRNTAGLKQEFKRMTIDSYKILSAYEMDAISVMTEEHVGMYENFGGFTVEKELQSYGSIDKQFLVTRWNTSKISPFFKRIFLRNVA
jgi:hypothetical protein